jgi:hypothetical protein
MSNDELRGAIYTTQALLKQAADALQENVDSLTKSHTDPVTGLVDDEARLSIESDQDLIDRLRAAAVPVCQKPEPVQEPVAWRKLNGFRFDYIEHQPALSGMVSKDWRPLYDTTPPAAQRQWVGLTNRDLDELACGGLFTDRQKLAKAIEAKLRERNT